VTAIPPRASSPAREQRSEDSEGSEGSDFPTSISLLFFSLYLRQLKRGKEMEIEKPLPSLLSLPLAGADPLHPVNGN
jgi:hypothetical protein